MRKITLSFLLAMLFTIWPAQAAGAQTELYSESELKISPLFTNPQMWNCTVDKDGFFLDNICGTLKGSSYVYDTKRQDGTPHGNSVNVTWYSTISASDLLKTANYGYDMSFYSKLYDEYITETRPLGDLKLEGYSLVGPTYGGASTPIHPEFIIQNGQKIGIGFYYLAYGGDASAGVVNYEIVMKSPSKNALITMNYIVEYPEPGEIPTQSEWNLFLESKGLDSAQVVSTDIFEEYLETKLSFNTALMKYITALKDSAMTLNKTIFTDVSSAAAYYDAIAYVKDKGIVSGYSDGSYKPDAAINRAEFTKILISTGDKGSLGYWETDATAKCFSDFTKKEWYTSYVCYAKSKGIISGNPDGTFKPANSINLAEALKIILNQYHISAEVIVDQPWYAGYIKAGKENNILLGIEAKPDHLVTRAEMASMIYQTEQL